jgi:hypothetical protein
MELMRAQGQLLYERSWQICVHRDAFCVLRKLWFHRDALLRATLEILPAHGRTFSRASQEILHVQGRTILRVSLEIVRAVVHTILRAL